MINKTVTIRKGSPHSNQQLVCNTYAEMIMISVEVLWKVFRGFTKDNYLILK
jgi:hypothetical protein